MQQLALKTMKIPSSVYDKSNKNNIKISYLHAIEYIQPFTNDNKEAPREDRPITIH